MIGQLMPLNAPHRRVPVHRWPYRALAVTASHRWQNGIQNLATEPSIAAPSKLGRAYNADRRCCSARVSSGLQQALSRPAAQRPASNQRGDVPHSYRTVRSGDPHPASLVCLSMFRKLELSRSLPGRASCDFQNAKPRLVNSYSLPLLSPPS